VNLKAPNLGPRLSIVDEKGKLLARLGGDNGPGLEAGKFLAPHGLALDSRGDIYVGEVASTDWQTSFPETPQPKSIRPLQKWHRLRGTRAAAPRERPLEATAMRPALPAVSLVAVPGRRRATLEIARDIERRGFAAIFAPSLHANMSLCEALCHITDRIVFASSIAPIYARTVGDFAQ